jgi:DNA-binding response OmpR family regulator
MLQNNATALLLEDEVLIAMDVEQALGEAGFNVSTVLSCADAETWLQARRPDLVIVDIKLRDGPSDTIVTGLVKDGIPFIVHSGDEPSLYADTPFSRGVWMSKPSNRSELVAAALQAVKSAI